MMSIVFYLYLLAPFVAVFALSYFPLVFLGRLLAKQRLRQAGDGSAPFAGALGTAVAFLFFGSSDIDRFALASAHVRTAWQSSGFAYELMQPLFSGGMCALVILIVASLFPRLGPSQRIVTPLTATLLSFVDFSFWPVLFSPFV